jgi:hypothetical protein
MKSHYLFEFMDQNWVPRSLRTTMREILECCLSKPFRGYYEMVAAEVRRTALSTGCTTIVELGAGTAPIATCLASSGTLPVGTRLVVTDLKPDREHYHRLQARFPNVIFPIYDSVDISKPLNLPQDTLFVLSASFHHLPESLRAGVLKSLSTKRVVVCEPMQRNAVSAVFAAASIIPALLAPLILRRRTGILRRIFWCWLLPVAGPFLAWDGIVSSLRCWTVDEWRMHLMKMIEPGRQISTRGATCEYMVSW